MDIDFTLECFSKQLISVVKAAAAYCYCCCRPPGWSLWEGGRASCWWPSEWTAGWPTRLHSQRWTQCSLEGGLTDAWCFCTCGGQNKLLVRRREHLHAVWSIHSHDWCWLLKNRAKSDFPSNPATLQALVFMSWHKQWFWQQFVASRFFGNWTIDWCNAPAWDPFRSNKS